MKRRPRHKRLPSHPAWRTDKDDFIQRIYGWGKLIDVTRGFDVRFPRSYGHKQTYFSVKMHGSERAALKAARAHRDRLVASSGAPEKRAGQRRTAPYMKHLRTNNKSGMVGLTRVTSKRGDAYWIAWYHPSPGKQKRRSWSVKRYTDEGARQLAILWRAEMLRSLR